MPNSEQTNKSVQQAVFEIIESSLEGCSKAEQESWLQDLAEHGCVSGMVSPLIYYHQTESFFDQHADEILELAHLLDFNINIVEVGLTQFKNNMAWFTFEVLAANYEAD